jgi:hypothetical protein
VGIALLVSQLALIGHARFTPARWLCWAPNDYATHFHLAVTVAGQPLSETEVMQRYRLKRSDWYENPPANLIDIVRQYEQTYGRSDGARVALAYRLNGRDEQTWEWPER